MLAEIQGMHEQVELLFINFMLAPGLNEFIAYKAVPLVDWRTGIVLLICATHPHIRQSVQRQGKRYVTLPFLHVK